MLKRFSILFSCAISLLLWQSCANSGSNSGKIKSIRYAYAISLETADAWAQRMDVLKAYLQQHLGLPVETFSVTGYEPMIEAMCANKVDVASMGPFEYVIASSKGCGEVIAARGTDAGQPATYQSTIAVNGSSPIKTLADLKAHSHELTFAFTDPASTSGHLVPRAGLVASGIDPEKDFKKVMFGMGQMAHMQTALMLKSEKVDAAAMMDKVIEYLIAQGRLKPNEIRRLWLSAPIPNDPIVVRKGLPAEVKAKLRDAFINMAGGDPKVMKAMTIAHISSGTRYVAVSDTLFDPLRKIARNTPNLHILDNK